MAEKSSEASILSVVDHIYMSVEHPELWPETTRAIGDLLGGPRDFWLVDKPLFAGTENMGQRTMEAASAGCHGTFVLSRADLQLLNQYTEEFGELIVRFLRNIFISMLLSPDEFAERDLIGLKMTRLYLDDFSASDFVFTAPSKSRARQMIARMWETGRIFYASHLQLLRQIVPHLDRALRLQMRLVGSKLQPNAISGVLDQLTLGVILIDDAGICVSQNRRAKEIFAQSDALRLSSTGLIGRTPSETNALRAIVDGALHGKQGSLGLSRGDYLRPILLTAVSLRVETASVSDQFASCAVFITDPDRVDNPSVATLRRAFDLTYREAEMAIAIARGQGLKAAAVDMGIAVTTARSQLKQAFAKTGTKHQAELAALVRTLTQVREG
jgi:DNA-binding CsgD family transcriptional regulator